MLINHPKIYLDATGTATDALLIRDGRVLATGDDARHGADSTDDTITPDAACLFPALGDAHIHLWGLGLRAGAVDLRGLDADAALEAIAGATPQTEGWVFGINLDEHRFSQGQHINRDDLDRLFPDQPVCIHRVDRHAIWVNSAALERADFENTYQKSDAGHARRDDRGRLDGYLVDQAMEPVLDALPERTLSEDRDVFFESANKLRDCGVAFGTVAWSPTTHLPMLEELADENKLPLHLDILLQGTDPDLGDWLQRGPQNKTDQHLRVAGIKFFADGALGSAGAHLLSPYKQGGRGLRMHDAGFLDTKIPELMHAGWQVAVHAIGNAAVREVLDAYEKVSPPVRTRLRPRLEHAQMVAPQDRARFDDLNVIASIQPIHLRSDAPWAPDVLDEEQLEHLFCWRDLLPAGLAAGSDYPIDDLNPWHGIATALTRKGTGGVPFRPEHALTRTEILAAYTSGAAFASHREQELGSLHPGFRAEICALDVDPFEADADQIWDTKAQFLS